MKRRKGKKQKKSKISSKTKINIFFIKVIKRIRQKLQEPNSSNPLSLFLFFIFSGKRNVKWE